MKTLKFIIFLIVLGFLALIYFQNAEYLTAKQSLMLDLKFKTWQWTFPELWNLAYFGICFVIGFIIAAFYGLGSKLKSKQIIKSLNATIDSHAAQISSLRTELEVFTNDPYIKKQAEEKQEPVETEVEEPA